MSYKQKIDKILREQAITPAQLAEQLGITGRTLSDFMREDGREPSGAVARLLDLMAGETNLGGQFLKIRRLLVAVHRDFVQQAHAQTQAKQSAKPVDVINDVSRYAEMSVSTSADKDVRISSDMHYVNFAPSGEDSWAVVESFKARKINPHFLGGKNISDNTLDCYFSAAIMWQISRRLEDALSDVVIAANFDKFCHFARYIKEETGVKVFFAFHNEADITDERRHLLNDSGIVAISLGSGRKLGKVMEKYDGYGYIYTDDEKRVFFHWNSMHKEANGKPEFSFENISKESTVSFVLDKNHKGPCANDVKLIKWPQQEQEQEAPIPSKKRKNISEDELCDAIEDAIKSCAGEDGLAVQADVGNRVKIKLDISVPDILVKYFNFQAGSKLKDFVIKHPNKFINRDEGNEPTGKNYWIGLK